MKQPTYKFTQRDSELLVELYKHRFLTVSQLQRLHFPSKQTAYRRLRVLKTAGMVAAFDVPNIEESIFTPASKGLTVIAQALGVERDDLHWSQTTAKPRDYYFMRHFLAINDFRITLKQACESSDVKLLGFIPDYYGERTGKSGVTKYIRDVICDVAHDRQDVSHTPDGVFALERCGKQALFFIEIDRGTETISDADKGVLKSLRFYANYLLDGKYQRYAKDFGVREFKGFRSLLVTTSAVRIANIRAAAASLQVVPKVKRFHWIATSEQVTPETLLTPIWVSSDPTDHTAYHIG